MEQSNKYIYEPNEFKVKISQCKNCANKTKNNACALFAQIPLDILTNKKPCSSKKES